MEYQKVINLLSNTNNQPSKIKTRNCVEVNDDDACGADNTNSQIKIKTMMLKSSLCGYNAAMKHTCF